MRRYQRLAIPLSIGLLVVISVASRLKGGDLTITVAASDYQIINGDRGQRIEMEGFGYLMEPGKPMLPAKNFLIALPPGAQVQSVEVRGIGAKQLPGTYHITPSPPIMPLVDPSQYPQLVEKMQREWQRNNDAVYLSDHAYPKGRGKLKGSGSLRKYSYASISFYPFNYHPQSGRLIHYSAAHVTINYTLPSPGSLEAQRVEELKWDTVADERASKLFANYQEVRELYHPKGTQPKTWQQTHDYVIITTSALSNAISSSGFVNWKFALGYNVRIVLITDTEVASQAGSDLAEQIRNFLRSYYGPWGIEYVLLVGDYATVPMRYCYPDSSNHTNGAGDVTAWPWAGDVPTDYYYADLSSPDTLSWDSDGDGFRGEYGQDSPDFLAEVCVGRIPTNNTTRITYTLNKMVSFEQDSGPWKNQALHAAAIAYYANEDHSGRELKDLATYIDLIETDIMSDWTISHYSEQEGLAPSAYPWSALSEAAFIADWRNGQYGVVNWGGHGWTDRVVRRVWSWDDGDSVPESNELSGPNFISIYSNLDDDYPSIVFALSCVVGYPEPNAWANLGIDLLTKPSFGSSAGIVSGTRVVWVSKGGGELHCYEFNHYMINGPSGPEKVGNALYDSEFYINQTYSWDHYAEYWDIFTFNLYGDPSMVREGVSFPDSEFVRGDVAPSGAQDGAVTMADGLMILAHYYGQMVLECMDGGDVNDDGDITMGDGLRALGHYYGDPGTMPEPPFPDCGTDPTPDDNLYCISQTHCNGGEAAPLKPSVSVKGTPNKLVRRQAVSKDGMLRLPVDLIITEDVLGCAFLVDYDASQLSFVGLAGGEGYDFYRSYVVDEASGFVRVGCIPDLELRDIFTSGEHRVAELEFRVTGSAVGIEFGLDEVEVVNRSFLNVPVEWVVKTGVDNLPSEFALSQNYPNPFNPTTLIKYDLPVDCQVRLDVYNVVGQRVATLVDGHQKAGYKVVRWNAGSLSSGIYFYRLQAGDFVQTRKMILLR